MFQKLKKYLGSKTVAALVDGACSIMNIPGDYYDIHNTPLPTEDSPIFKSDVIRVAPGTQSKWNAVGEYFSEVINREGLVDSIVKIPDIDIYEFKKLSDSLLSDLPDVSLYDIPDVIDMI